MHLSIQKIHEILLNEQLLKEYVSPEGWHLSVSEKLQETIINHLSYDSRNVTKQTLFFCKGLQFKEEYLVTAVQNGLQFYIAETPYDNISAELGIIVTDIRKAMALLSMAFYDYPQNKLQLVGFTGTKGKTTAAYFTKSILDRLTNKKTALLSTMNSTLDGKTFFKSTLTTPESLDLYRMMDEAVKNGMTHLVMEVSSQAYKTNRVYKLFFDVGIFLNITPDHISPIEHPTFDDYFYCKRQLIVHSKKVVLNKESDYFNMLVETANAAQVPTVVYGNSLEKETDYAYQINPEDSLQFSIVSKKDPYYLNGDYHLKLGGDFNKSNALSAAIASALVGAKINHVEKGIASTTVPGRMEQLTNRNNAKVYVDYAHNYDSLHHLLTYVKEQHPKGRLIVVIGSTGNKAISRRKDFGRVLTELADVAILTTDDPADERPENICAEIQSFITKPMVVETIIDRETAIKRALEISQSEDAVVLAGKGADQFQKIKGKDVPYEGDFLIAEQLINN